MTRFARAGDPYVEADVRTEALHWDPCWRGIVGVPPPGPPCTGSGQTVHRVAPRVLIRRWLSRRVSRVSGVHVVRE